jgi:hypothetical protein
MGNTSNSQGLRVQIWHPLANCSGALMVPESLVGGIEIIRGNNGITRETKLVLFINGRWAKAPRSAIALLSCLHDEIGYLVPYERLCSIIGHEEATTKQKHVLRQYMTAIKRVLEEHKAGCAVAVVDGAGYVLCHKRRHRQQRKITQSKRPLKKSTGAPTIDPSLDNCTS